MQIFMQQRLLFFVLLVVGLVLLWVFTQQTNEEKAKPVTKSTYHVAGRFLYDPCGEKVTIRGVENFFWNPWLYPDGSIIPEIAKTGANTIRLLPTAGTGGDTSGLSVAQIEQLIKRAIENHLLPEIAISEGKEIAAYLQPEMKAMLLKYQDKILMYAAGEGTQESEEQWEVESKAKIAKLREAGYTAPLHIASNTFGRNLPTLLHRAPAVLASDPLKNIIFGWQAYWNTDGYYQDLYGMSLAQAMQKLHDAPFMTQIGIMNITDPWNNNVSMDYRAVMRDAKRYDLGWMWWDWRLTGDSTSLTTDGIYDHWEGTYAKEVVSDDVNSLRKTSVRTYFQNHGSCKAS